MNLRAVSSELVALEQRLAESVLSRCDAIATCSEINGSIFRPFLSASMERCNRLAGSWMADASMQVVLDQAGNLRGIYESDSPGAPRLLIGSHLDTVPNAGKYDGILGVMLGISLVESLGGRRLPFAIEVIGFSDEEGVRFGLPFIGSRAIVGDLRADHRMLLDAEGIPLAAALETFRNTHPEAVAAELHPDSRAYLEFHIEQGPVLDEAGERLAAVDAIAGQSRATVLFNGRAGHAGTTPMALRRDAMTAAAEWILVVEATALATPGMVASTGRITCEPGATNIIPGLVRCSLDLRSAEESLRREALHSILDAAVDIAARRRVEMSYTIDVEQHGVELDASLTSLAGYSIGALQTRRMVSGAGHDAMVLAPHIPSAMIFVRSPGGVSHHPDESVLLEDVTEAIRAGIRFIENFAQWMTTGEPPCTT